MIKVSTIKPNPNNPRQIRDEKFEKLKRSIADFPKMMALRPMIVDETNTVLGGNMRLNAIKALGMKEIPDDWVKRADELSADETKRFIITDNSSFGEYDWDAIANEWSDEPLADWGLDVPDFEAVDDESGGGESESAAAAAVDKAVELQAKWKTAKGQVWHLGEHRIICGDSTSEGDICRLMQSDTINLVWTDPPYGVSYGDKLEAANPMGYRVRHIANDSLSDPDLKELIRKALSNAHKHSADKCSIYVACPAGKQLPTLISAFVGSGFEFRWQLIWEKDSLVLSRADYHFRHENILYGWKEKGSHYFTEERNHDSIFTYPRPKVSEEHPTMKPPALIQDMIRNSSVKGDIVFDCFNGSGSSLIACEAEGRLYRGVELEPKYIAVTLERWHLMTGKDPVLSSTYG